MYRLRNKETGQIFNISNIVIRNEFIETGKYEVVEKKTTSPVSKKSNQEK